MPDHNLHLSKTMNNHANSKQWISQVPQKAREEGPLFSCR